MDGLRGVAAMAVVWAHMVVYLGLMPHPVLGVTGVLVFFVLSGYLIARIVARAGDTPRAYRTFVRRRAVRLGPAVLALAVVGPCVLLTLTDTPAPEVLTQGAWVLTQTSSLPMAAGLPLHPILGPTWSLSVEWTFYVGFPLGYRALVRRGCSTLTGARYAVVAAVALYLVALPLRPAAFYYLPVANLGVMVLGAALGLAHHAGWTGPERLRLGIWPAGGLAMILILIVLPGSPLQAGYRFAVLPATALATALVINGCVAGHPIHRLLATPLLRAVGLRAYSLYLWHMSVLWVSWRLRGDSASWTTAGIACLALIPVVELSYRLFEVPVLRGGTNALQSRAGASAARPEMVEQG